MLRPSGMGLAREHVTFAKESLIRQDRKVARLDTTMTPLQQQALPEHI